LDPLKALFGLVLHGIKRGLFWQRNPHAHREPVTGCPPSGVGA
jgi:hypothetical protein